MRRTLLITVAVSLACLAQTTPTYYSITTVGGSYPLGDGGPATSALLLYPRAIAIDSSGNLYIADTSSNRIRKVASSGQISTVAGTGLSGFGGEGVQASASPVSFPVGVAFDRAGNLYIAESSRLRRMTPAGVITTVAGTGGFGSSGDGGPATAAQVSPVAIAVDGDGNLYISEGFNSHRVRKVTPSGTISTIAGTGSAGFSGDGGPGNLAQLNFPANVAVDGAGNLYIADQSNQRIRKVTPSGTISTVVGTGAFGSGGDGGPASLAQLASPSAVFVDTDGNMYIAEGFTNRIRKVGTSGVISTMAGNGILGFSGDGGPATSASFYGPSGMAVDAGGSLYIVDSSNHRIRRVDSSGTINTVAGSTHLAGDGGPATSALLLYPAAVALDSAGNLLIADTNNNRIRKVTSSGTISTVAGSGTGPGRGGDGSQATSAGLSFPRGIAVDSGGNLYIADSSNRLIRRVTPTGVISTFAGNGGFGSGGDGGLATAAQFSSPVGVAVDAAGNVYIADSFGNKIRRVRSSGVIDTFAGTGTRGFTGDGGPATAAQLSNSSAVAVDSASNVYIADTGNNRIRKVTPSGMISTAVGNGTCCTGGDGGSATSAQVGFPTAFAFDSAGNLYVTTAGVIRKVSASGTISTIAGGSGSGFAGDGGLAILARLSPAGLAVDGTGNVFVADSGNHRIRKLSPLVPTRLSIVSGDGQSGAVGTRLAGSLVVKVADSAGIGVPAVTVTFTVTSGSARLSTASAVTGADGIATVDVTLGETAGTVTITASATALEAVRFTVTATPSGTTPGGPRINAGGVVGAGLSGVKQISPNAIISIFGDAFAPPGTARSVVAADLVNGALPTKLAGVCVQVGSQLAPIFALYPSQLNVQAPSLTGSGGLTVQVILNCGETNEIRSNLETVTLQAASPEFFFFVHRGSGGAIAATNAVTGAYIGAADLIPGGNFTPAKPGDILTLYATGLGLTNPQVDAGQLPDKVASVVGRVVVTVAGVQLRDEDVLYAGVTPSNAGLYQLNVRLPAETPDGDLPVVVKVADFATPAGAFLTVRR